MYGTPFGFGVAERLRAASTPIADTEATMADEDTPPTGSSPESEGPRHQTATMPPRYRFGLNDPPNEHISRDTPPVLRKSVAGATPPQGEVSVAHTPGSDAPIVQTVQTVQVEGTPRIDWLNGTEAQREFAAARRQANLNAASSDSASPPFPTPGSFHGENPSVGEPARFKWTARTKIGAAVLQNEDAINLLAASFLSFIEDKLSTLQQTPPNSEEAKAILAQEIADYEDLKRRIEAFLTAAALYSANHDTETAVVESTVSFAEGLSNWWTKKHIQICDKAYDVGLFTLGAGVCWLAGAGGELAAIVPGVLVGGKPVVEVLKAWSKAKQN
jgi:hypothetical protein